MADLIKDRCIRNDMIGAACSPYSWDDCKSEVNKYPGAVFKKFASADEAESFIAERSGSSFSNKRSYSSYSSGYSSSSSENLVTKYFKRDSNASKSKCNRVNSNEINYSSRSSSSESYSTGSRSFSSSNNGFKKDSDGRVDIYTDGACTSNGSKNARAGIGVYFGDDHPSNVSKPVQGRITNNSAEIEAVIEAAKVAKDNGLNKIRINTDSKFLINCQTKWMNKWKATGWISTERLNVTCTFYGTKIKLTQSEPFTGVMYIKDRKNICKQTYKNVTTPMFIIKHDTCSTVNKNGSSFNLIVKSNNYKTIGVKYTPEANIAGKFYFENSTDPVCQKEFSKGAEETLVVDYKACVPNENKNFSIIVEYVNEANETKKSRGSGTCQASPVQNLKFSKSLTVKATPPAENQTDVEESDIEIEMIPIELTSESTLQGDLKLLSSEDKEVDEVTGGDKVKLKIEVSGSSETLAQYNKIFVESCVITSANNESDKVEINYRCNSTDPEIPNWTQKDNMFTSEYTAKKLGEDNSITIDCSITACIDEESCPK
ncbi:hypothetical protein G9C98_004827, partial [Cotesia typhae]